MKRIIDITLSIILAIILLPFFVIISFFIYLDGGNIFYSQVRVGLYGTHFKIIKFRTMVINAESVGGFRTHEGDPRVTKIGRLLRRSSLDELPQLFNVIFGDMSIVGPRPNVPKQESEYTPAQWRKRNSVRPGITGLAQALARSTPSWDKRYELDAEYIDKNNIMLDLKILFLTVAQLFKKGGY